MRKLRQLLKGRQGSEAVSFILTTGMLLCIFVTIITAFAYVSQCYNASYLCRRITRDIEVYGQYRQTEIEELLAGIQNDELQNIHVEVDASYLADKKIQLRQPFSVELTADYKVRVMQVGSDTLEIKLPIKCTVSGMSEVYWKE